MYFSNSKKAGLCFLVVGIFSYGWLWPVMSLGVNFIPPLWFATTRVFFGALVLMTILAVRGELKMPTRADLPAILSVGICMMGLYVSLVHTAMIFIPAGRGALLGYSTPLWVAPAAVLLFREKMNLMRASGVILGLSGLAVLFNPVELNWSDKNAWMGSGMCILAAISWSVAILQMRNHEWHLTPLQLGPWQLLLATAVTLPFSIWVEDYRSPLWSIELYGLLLYGGAIGTALGMWCIASAIQRLGALTTSVGLLGGPLVAITTSVLFLGEIMTLTLSGGLVLILGGIALVTIGEYRNK
jgi:drug/metabolite transporter (DMT)-like permease